MWTGTFYGSRHRENKCLEIGTIHTYRQKIVDSCFGGFYVPNIDSILNQSKEDIN